MKNSLVYFFSFILLLCTVQNAQAGFWVKKQSPAIEIVSVPAVTEHANSTKNEHHSRLMNSIRNSMPAIFGQNPYKKNQWFGMAALGCGILGLFIPGLNFAAILFGLLGLGRGCEVKGLAVAGFILGLVELLLFLLIGATFLSLILL